MNSAFRNEALCKAYDCLPVADVEYAMASMTRNATGKAKLGADADTAGEHRLKLGLCINLHNNRICENCCSKDASKLQLCTKCCLSWYCSYVCAAKHFMLHQLRCQNTQGCLDNGSMQLVMVHMR
jgi:hypothetical protein